MNKLYVIHLSVGLPMQRVYRSHRTVVCTGATKAAAEDRAIESLRECFPLDQRATVENIRVLCTTPDDVLTGAIL